MHLSHIKKKLYRACQNGANWVLSPPLFNVRHSTQLRVLSELLETHFGEFRCCGRTRDSAAGGLTWTTCGGIPTRVQHGCPWAGWMGQGPHFTLIQLCLEPSAISGHHFTPPDSHCFGGISMGTKAAQAPILKPIQTQTH